MDPVAALEATPLAESRGILKYRSHWGRVSEGACCGVVGYVAGKWWQAWRLVGVKRQWQIDM